MPLTRSRALRAAAVLLFAALPTSAFALGNPSLSSNHCLAGKIKCLTKRTSCLLGCYAKAAKTGVALDNATDACLTKCRNTFDGGADGLAAGCFGKLEAKGGCLFPGDTSPIGARSDVFVLTTVGRLDPAPLNNVSKCRSGKLKCVAKYDKCVEGLFAKAAKAGGQIDSAKLGKCLDVVTGGSKGVAASCFGKLDLKGGCETSNDGARLREHDDAYIDATLSGMSLGATDQHNERCTGDTSVRCSTAPGGTSDCGGSLGACEFWFGGPEPLVVGGVAGCATNHWSGPVSGTFNQQNGASAWTGVLTRTLYIAPTLLQPCPRCVGDSAQNDGSTDGTCSGGARNGLACDANGSTSVADFGDTSLDCPPTVGTIIGTEQIKLNANDDVASLTLSATSPTCNGEPGKLCACASCSGDASVACATTTDCSSVGAGTCTNNAGQPRQPNPCLDDTSTPVDERACTDTAPVGDGTGTCPAGPTDTRCAVESFRGCLVNTDCPAPGDVCAPYPRQCYLDNGVIGGSITAVGGHSAQVDHTSYATFASVHCLAPVSSSAANAAIGLPGAGRFRLGGMLTDDGTDLSCPNRASFLVTDADGVVDLGWTGLGQDQRFVSQAKLSVTVTGCSGSAPSCGVCGFTGPVLNPDAPIPPQKKVFVTSTTQTGNMGNLAGADGICQSLADGVGLGGTFKAWLSNVSTSAASRLTHSVDDYALVDGTVIAHGWADLTDGTLLAPINKDENGATVSAGVWTNATTSGAIDAAECLQWTSTLAGHKGQTGLSTATDATWTHNISFEDCALLRHLYCFEQ